MALNRCIFYGRLVRDPDLRHTPNGTAVVSFTIAVQRNFKNKDTGKYDVDFIDCIAWRNTAEYVGKFTSKGDAINVDGNLQSRKWVDKNGITRKNVEIVADNVYRCEVKSKNDDSYDEHGEEKYGDFTEVEDPENPDELPF